MSPCCEHHSLKCPLTSFADVPANMYICTREQYAPVNADSIIILVVVFLVNLTACGSELLSRASSHEEASASAGPVAAAAGPASFHSYHLQTFFWLPET
mmetsp:Transcript_52591/g.87299  ORF Transcript_52591/g.87299 Transcript_52591/m.87299 type:complete len:99 (+) Transcript_52591:166-462(+)